MTDKRCPVCGEGILQHLGTETPEGKQRVETPIRETYTCGHEVLEPPLEASAMGADLEVEHRTSEETAGP